MTLPLRLLAILALALALALRPDPAMATRRALLIGISDYQNVAKLDNPQSDIKHIGEKLTTADYVVTIVTDPAATRDKLITAIDGFLKSIKQGDEVLVYYSGHGVDINGDNMFVPADSPSSQNVDGAFALSERLIAMRPLMVQIEDHEPAIQVWIIDACRENPYAGGGRPFAAQGGLQKPEERTNSFILFAASYSQIARDTLPSEPPHSGLGSPFSRTFAALFDSWKDKDIGLFAAQLRRNVVELVKPDPQYPVFEDGILDQWCFVTCSTGIQQVTIASNTLQPATSPTAPPTTQTSTATFAPAKTPAIAGEPIYARFLGNPPAVYLGRDSSRDCTPSKVSGLYPFGCTALQQLARHFSGSNPSPDDDLAGHTLTVTTRVNVRRGVPRPGPNGTIYGCKVQALTHGATVKLVSTVALKYAGDTYYWGTMEGPPPDCMAG